MTAEQLVHLFGVEFGTLLDWIESGLPVFYLSEDAAPHTFNTADVFAWIQQRRVDEARNGVVINSWEKCVRADG